MLTQLILFLLFISGSVFGAAVLKKRFEVILPIFLLSIVLLLFIFGIAGLLQFGFYVVFCASAILIVFSVLHVFRKKQMKAFIRNMCTPAFILFTAMWAIFTVLNFGRLNSTYDEFTHWADVVKVMVTYNDFATNPLSNSMFPNYPPGTALLQYYVQKVYQLFVSGALFCEWRLYFTRQIFFVAIILPFLSAFQWKHFFQAVVAFLCLLLAPLALYNDYHSSFYSSLYIDSFLGILAATGFSMVMFWKHKDIYYHLYVLLICAMLVLTKQAGTLLAVFLAVFYFIVTVEQNRKKNLRQNLLFGFLAVISVAVPQLLWKWEVNSSHAIQPFKNSIDLPALWNVITHQENSYKADVWTNYFNRLRIDGVSLGTTGFTIPYYYLLAILLIGILLLLSIHRQPGAKKTTSFLHAFYMTAISVVYLVGIAVVYIFQFSQAEALGLASFQRYVRTIYSILWMICVLGICVSLYSLKGKSLLASLLLIAALFTTVTPWVKVEDFISRRSVRRSITWRLPLDVFCDEIKAKVKDEKAQIYVIAQETTGNEYMAIRYYIRPYSVNPWGSWSLQTPAEQETEWEQLLINPEDWENMLFAEYDYVALYKINDSFIQTYGNIFPDLKTDAAQALYYIDKEGHQLLIK